MSTATLSNLLEYLYGTLSPSNMRWVAVFYLLQNRPYKDSFDEFPLQS